MCRVCESKFQRFFHLLGRRDRELRKEGQQKEREEREEERQRNCVRGVCQGGQRRVKKVEKAMLCARGFQRRQIWKRTGETEKN